MALFDTASTYWIYILYIAFPTHGLFEFHDL